MKRTIDLGRLPSGLPSGVTPAVGGFMAEAASVILEHNHHQPGVTMTVKASKSHRYSLVWPPLHPDARHAHNDLPAAVEQGAYGIAFLVAEELTEFKVIEKSRKGTGFDYYLGTGDRYPFQKAARLEVSGIIGNARAVSGRVKQKLSQVDRSSGMPAYVVVVEFSTPVTVFRRKP